jgi:hypothetical protein
MDKYHVFSTDNMADWINHGEILARSDLDEVEGIGARFIHPTEGATSFMWAPDAAYSTSAPGKGHYFFIFPFVSLGAGGGEWGNNWTIGIAWSDQPHTGFKDNVVQLKDSNGAIVRGNGILIDPCVFYDEASDSHYLVVGGSQQARAAKLNADMVSLAEPWTELTSQLPRFHEGPWMFTRVNGSGTKLYYLMYASGNPTPNTPGSYMSYATSTAGPKGPWEFRGDVLTSASTDTNHGSIVEFKNKWYLFYHTTVLSGGGDTLRSVSVDELTFNADGTINTVTLTAAGVAAVGAPTSAASLDAKFGADTWKKELTYAEYLAEKEGGGNETLIGTYMVKDIYDAHTSSSPTITSSTTGVGAAIQLVLNLTHYGTGAVDPSGKGDWDFTTKTTAIHDFHIANSYAEFRLVDGETGGRARLEVSYGTLNGGSMLVTVNGTPLSSPLTMTPTGGWETFTGVSSVMIDVTAGETNTIRFSSASGNITGIKIYLKE